MRSTIIAAVAFEYEAIRRTAFNCFVDEYIEFGIGALESMYHLSSLTSRLANKNIIYVGSAGVLGSFSSPKIVTTSKVEWLPTGDRLGLSYPVPKFEAVPTIGSRSLISALESYPCICGPSVSVDAGNADSAFANYLENIELYGVAKKVAPIAKSFSVILGVSNSVGPSSHEQWKTNFRVCAQMTADHLHSISGKL